MRNKDQLWWVVVGWLLLILSLLRFDDFDADTLLMI